MVMGLCFPGPHIEDNDAGFFCNSIYFTFCIWFQADSYRVPAFGITWTGNIFYTGFFGTAKITRYFFANGKTGICLLYHGCYFERNLADDTGYLVDMV